MHRFNARDGAELSTTAAAAPAASAGTTGCPQRLNASPVLKGPERAAVVKIAGLRAAWVCRYYAEPIGGSPDGKRKGGKLAGSHWLELPQEVKSLGGLINDLEPWTKADIEAVRSCGEDNGSGAYIIFRYQDGSRASIKSHFSGCPSVTDSRHLYMLSGRLKSKIEQLVPLEPEG